jgi:hypothetical protein
MLRDLAVEEVVSSLNQDAFNGYNITRFIAHVGNSTVDCETIACAIDYESIGPHAAGGV